MNLVQEPPKRPGDDLDGLLRMFFRAQMPYPWPAPPTSHFRTEPAARPATSRRPLIRSRWALAASIALLLLGSLLLPGRFTPGSKPEQGPDGSTISDRPLKRDLNREHQKKQLDGRNKVGQGADDGDELPDPE
ncbi:MAG TPA: hypothetical protein VH643_30860 [Gemmataceae bacterium]|jgi:hypothetical protein